MYRRSFRLPPSPFAEEKFRLGCGFLAGYTEDFGPAPSTVRKPRNSVLSATEREIIGSSGKEIKRAQLAQVFGTTVSYVDRLRYNYRQAMERAS